MRDKQRKQKSRSGRTTMEIVKDNRKDKEKKKKIEVVDLP